MTEPIGLERYDLFMVLDVESIGLHGEGCAVGYAVYEAKRMFTSEEIPVPIEKVLLFCNAERARGTTGNHEWVKQHVKIERLKAKHTQIEYPSAFVFSELATPRAVREEFWRRYSEWQAASETKMALVGDTIWPVEANFLSACIEDGGGLRDWKGPYPFIDVCSLAIGIGQPHLSRLPSELPEHDPLNDALHSARTLWECWKRLK